MDARARCLCRKSGSGFLGIIVHGAAELAVGLDAAVVACLHMGARALVRHPLAGVDVYALPLAVVPRGVSLTPLVAGAVARRRGAAHGGDQAQQDAERCWK